VYSLTKAGDLFLSNWIDVLGRYQAVLQRTIEGMDREQALEDQEPDRPRTARR
jgi:hypothetical protein